MQEPPIQIISDGTSRGTRVMLKDGTELKGVTRIEIEPISPCGLVRASITFDRVALILSLGTPELIAIDRRLSHALTDSVCKQRGNETSTNPGSD